MSGFERVRAGISFRSKWGFRAVLMAGVLSVCGLTVPGHGQEAASVPNLNGIWGKHGFGMEVPYIGADGLVIGGYKSPIVKPWAAEMVRMRALAHGQRLINPHVTCWPEGIALLGLRAMQIFQTPSLIVIFYDDDHHSRRIFMNQPHSDHPKPSWLGESVGHFEGDTLVVDTIGYAPKIAASIDRYGIPVTGGLHVVERYRLVDDPLHEPWSPTSDADSNAYVETLDMEGKTLMLKVTVEDPNVFHQPWSAQVNYRRNRIERIREVVCAEGNRTFFDLMPIADKPDF